MSKIYLESGTYIVELENYDGSSITNMRVAEASAPNTWYSFGSVALESPNPSYDGAYIGTHDHKFVGFGANEAAWAGNNFIIFTPTGLADGQSITTDSLLLSGDWGSLYNQTGFVTTDVKSELAYNLKGHWSFDNGDATADVGPDGSASGGVTFGLDSGRTVASFTGTSSYIDLGHTSNMNIGTSDFTVGAWVRADDISVSAQQIFGSIVTGASSPSMNGFHLLITEGKLRFIIGSNGVSDYISDYTLPAGFEGVWKHVMATRSGTEIKLFIDGSLIHTQTVSAVHNLESTTSWHKYGIGAYSWNNAWYSNYVGGIDDARIYSMALDASQVSDLYNATIVTPVSDPTVSIDGDVSSMNLSDSVTVTIELNGNSLDAPGNGYVFKWEHFDGGVWDLFQGADNAVPLSLAPSMSNKQIRAAIKVNEVYYYSDAATLPDWKLNSVALE